MGERLLSVGLDVGTTSTQMVVSELMVENQASAFSVPEMTISRRKVLYESPVYFTPLLGQDRVDGQGIRAIVEKEYARAGISREQVDTGAVIITGETSRKENARAVLDALAELAGDFVVATAGPDLESVLAAKGAGAVALSVSAYRRCPVSVPSNGPGPPMNRLASTPRPPATTAIATTVSGPTFIAPDPYAGARRR
jgi:ethanolamine utilization protein EutA (predicted chaperonin)